MSSTYQHFLFITKQLCATVVFGCSRLRKRFRAYDSTLANARRKIPGVRHRFSPLFISPLGAITISRGRNAISENRVAPRLFRPFHQARTAASRPRASNWPSITRHLQLREGTRRFATDVALPKTREKPMFRALR